MPRQTTKVLGTLQSVWYTRMQVTPRPVGELLLHRWQKIYSSVTAAMHRDRCRRSGSCSKLSPPQYCGVSGSTKPSAPALPLPRVLIAPLQLSCPPGLRCMVNASFPIAFELCHLFGMVPSMNNCLLPQAHQKLLASLVHGRLAHPMLLCLLSWIHLQHVHVPCRLPPCLWLHPFLLSRADGQQKVLASQKFLDGIFRSF